LYVLFEIRKLINTQYKKRKRKILNEVFKKIGCIVGTTCAVKRTVSYNVLDRDMKIWIETPEDESVFSLFDPTPDLG
ncbi:hypothetical protein, partial [Bacillus cereus]|uniref:hypothetical protein n=1 Tax=Bacillus cereus TaxID=1396 RepID=UPI0021117EC3|nr:hypothetical protein [Bacillus cereus]